MCIMSIVFTANKKIGAGKRFSNSFVLIEGHREEAEDVAVTYVLLLPRCFLKRETEGYGPLFLNRKECALPQNAANDSLGCVFL